MFNVSEKRKLRKVLHVSAGTEHLLFMFHVFYTYTYIYICIHPFPVGSVNLPRNEVDIPPNGVEV